MNTPSRLLFLLFLLGVSGIVYGQQAQLNNVQEERRSYPVAGSHLLQKDHAMVSEYFRQHPGVLQQMRLRKAAWTFSVGSTMAWKSVNIATNAFFDVPSTCRAAGTRCYVFAEDAVWNTNVTQAVVDSVKKAFDQSTPADPSRGIFQMNIDAFGEPPDVDGDPKIIILIMDIQDGYDGGGYVAGYFHSLNELPKNINSNSNEAEIYYLDCNPAGLTTQKGLVEGMGTTAHEFQHMIHFNYDNNEIKFVNEGCSLIAEVNAGYPLYSQTRFTSEPNHYLLDWRSGSDEVLKDYSRAARYMLYMRDQVGMGVFKPMVQSGLNDIAGINSALQSIGTPLRFPDVTGNWLVANTVNARTVDTVYGYKYPHVPAVAAAVYYNPTVPMESRTVQGYAADYLSFVGGSDLSVTFILPSGSPLQIKAVKTGTGETEVAEVPAGAAFQVPEFGSTVSTVTFVVMNATASSSANYSVQAAGSGGHSQVSTLSYASYSFYYITLPSPNQKFAMRFSPVTSGRIISVSLAINDGSDAIKGNGSLKVSAANNITGSVAGIPSTQIGSAITVPFSKLSTGWNEINMLDADANVTQGADFHIVWEVEGAAGDTLQFLLDNGTTSPTTRASSYREGVNGLNWYNRADPNYAAGKQPSQENFLIAVRIGVPTEVEKNPSAARLSEYALFQNYPNPFNPATTIGFTLQGSGFTTLRVYDILGREAATLVNEEKEAGNHTVRFDASTLSGGIYFYTLHTNNFSATRKMLMLK